MVGFRIHLKRNIQQSLLLKWIEDVENNNKRYNLISGDHDGQMWLWEFNPKLRFAYFKIHEILKSFVIT